jgi:hypothetical protein
VQDDMRQAADEMRETMDVMRGLMSQALREKARRHRPGKFLPRVFVCSWRGHRNRLIRATVRRDEYGRPSDRKEHNICLRCREEHDYTFLPPRSAIDRLADLADCA